MSQLQMDPSTEPLLTHARLNLYPIQYPDIWDLYQKAKASFWVPEEVDLSSDPSDWEQLDHDEQHFLLRVLAFFAGSDLIVNEHLDDDFAGAVKVPELKMFYHFQEMMEDIHTAQYQLLIEALVKEVQKKQTLLESTLLIPSIRGKAEWARRWIAKGTWVQRLVAFSIVEGIFFSASFCSIYWIKKKGLMKGLCQSNEFIARDEGMHRDMACLLYRQHILQKLPKSTVVDMIKDAVQVEKQFVQDCLPYKLMGMNQDLMCQYVEFVADSLSYELIGEKIYHQTNPFSWMNLISMEGKTNFFEKKVSSYSRQAALVDNKTENIVSFDAEF